MGVPVVVLHSSKNSDSYQRPSGEMMTRVPVKVDPVTDHFSGLFPFVPVRVGADLLGFEQHPVR